MHAFYSAKMAEALPHTVVFYENGEGEKVMCTAVSPARDTNGGLDWSDAVYVGEVEKFHSFAEPRALKKCGPLEVISELRRIGYPDDRIAEHSLRKTTDHSEEPEA